MYHLFLFIQLSTSTEDTSMNTSETSSAPVNIPENTTSFGYLLFPLPQEEKILIRRLEKAIYKLNAAETAIIFNETCLREGLLPRYYYYYYYY